MLGVNRAGTFQKKRAGVFLSMGSVLRDSAEITYLDLARKKATIAGGFYASGAMQKRKDAVWRPFFSVQNTTLYVFCIAPSSYHLHDFFVKVHKLWINKRPPREGIFCHTPMQYTTPLAVNPRTWYGRFTGSLKESFFMNYFTQEGEIEKMIDAIIEDFKREFPTAYRHYQLLEDGCVSEKTKGFMCDWMRERLRLLLLAR